MDHVLLILREGLNMADHVIFDAAGIACDPERLPVTIDLLDIISPAGKDIHLSIALRPHNTPHSWYAFL